MLNDEIKIKSIRKQWEKVESTELTWQICNVDQELK